MEIDEAIEYVHRNHNAVLATLKQDGSPQLSPVTVGVDADDRVIISTRQTAYKVRHVRRDPRVWLCVFPPGFYGQWVQLEGTAEIVELPEAMDGLIAYYRRHLRRAPRLGRVPCGDGAGPAPAAPHHGHQGRPDRQRLTGAGRSGPVLVADAVLGDEAPAVAGRACAAGG